jgi:glucose/arabinose dehydrogenase
LTCPDREGIADGKKLNHGLALSPDGRTLYASTTDAAFSWTYDAASMAVGATNKTLVGGMATEDHVTRTLLIPQKVDGLLVVSRGSTENIDPAAEQLASGHSQIKVFNLTNITSQGYNFNTDGLRLGWGLRNDVGVAEHPLTGGIYSVENSADQITRDGQDIHEDNPGEEMNFFGYLNGTAYANQGRNFGCTHHLPHDDTSRRLTQPIRSVLFCSLGAFGHTR